MTGKSGCCLSLQPEKLAYNMTIDNKKRVRIKLFLYTFKIICISNAESPRKKKKRKNDVIIRVMEMKRRIG